MTKDQDNDMWWRCVVDRSAHWDDDYDTTSHYTYHVRWVSYRVLRTTPKGAWVYGTRTGGLHFVLGTAVKQLCVPTRELAMRDAVKRAERHIAGCRHRLAIAERTLSKLHEVSPTAYA